MTRFRHDHFAQQFLSDLLEFLGTVEPNRKITDETREIDLYVIPDLKGDPQPLGLLGRMVSRQCLLEPFRNAVVDSEIRSALIKQSEERELIMNLSPIFLEWEAQTRVRAERKAALSMAQRLLRRRLGILPSDLQHQIEYLSVESLEDLGEALFDITTIDELTNWLDRQ